VSRVGVIAEWLQPTHVGLLVSDGNRVATEIPADFNFHCQTETVTLTYLLPLTREN